MKILITGGSSLLGKYLLKTAPQGYRIDTTWYTNFVGPQTNYHMDLSSATHVDYVMEKSRPDIVIHCAANGSVDYAEKNYENAHKTNVEGTINIVRATLRYDAKIVYISSNAVFDGSKPPYGGLSVREPINNYGKIKRLAEDSVIQHKANWLIIRPYLLYGYPWKNGRRNWATIIASALASGREVKLVNDVIWQPTYVGDCAKAIWKLLFQNRKAYNVSSGDSMTLYDFGLKIARSFGLNKSGLIPVSSDHFVGIAPRPKDTSYDLKALDEFGIKILNVDEGLQKMKKDGA